MGLQPLQVFISHHSGKDDAFCEMLVTHLTLLVQQKAIEIWHARLLAPGSNRTKSIDENLGAADIIICLISADYLASEPCNAQMERALKRQTDDKAVVVPVLIRSVDRHGAPFSGLQVLPRNNKPVAEWADQDQAWSAIVKDLRALAKQWQERAAAPVPPLGSATGKPSPKEAYLAQLRGAGSAPRLVEQCQPRHQSQGSYFSMAWSPDGRYLAAGYGHPGSDGIELWEANTWRRCHWLTGHTQSVMSLAFRPDGSMLASGSHDQTIRLWNPHDGRSLRTLHEHHEGILGLCFWPTGEALVSASLDRTLRVWDPSTGDQLQVLTEHRFGVSGVSVSADGAYIASCSNGGFESRTGEIYLWTVMNNTFSPSPLIDGQNRWPNWNAIAFNSAPRPSHWPGLRCSTRLGAAGDDGRIYVWDLATQQLLRVLRGGHNREVTALSFDRHPAALASASRDNTVRVWDIESDRVPPTLGRHDPGHGVMAVSVSPGGNRIASAGLDHTIRVWNVATRSCLVVLAHAGRGWVAYVPGQGRYKWGGDLAGEFVLRMDGHDLGPDELADSYPELRVPEAAVLST